MVMVKFYMPRWALVSPQRNWGNYQKVSNQDKLSKSKAPAHVDDLTWVFPKNRGTPKWMVKIMENPI